MQVTNGANTVAIHRKANPAPPDEPLNTAKDSGTWSNGERASALLAKRRDTTVPEGDRAD